MHDIEKQQCKNLLREMTHDQFYDFAKECFAEINDPEKTFSFGEKIGNTQMVMMIHEENKRRKEEVDKAYTKALLK